MKSFVPIPKSIYSLTFYPNLVVIHQDANEVASIEVVLGKALYTDRDLLVFGKLPGMKEYLIGRNRTIRVPESLGEVVGYHDQLMKLKKNPPFSLHNANPNRTYTGGSWVVLIHSEVPISHYRLVW